MAIVKANNYLADLARVPCGKKSKRDVVDIQKIDGEKLWSKGR